MSTSRGGRAWYAFIIATAGAVIAGPVGAVTFTPFAFASQVSTSGAFDGVNGIYGNGDVRLDGVTIGSSSY